MPDLKSTPLAIVLLLIIVGGSYLLSEIAIAGSWTTFLRQTFESTPVL